jgi:hypothetical protein
MLFQTHLCRVLSGCAVPTRGPADVGRQAASAAPTNSGRQGSNSSRRRYRSWWSHAAAVRLNSTSCPNMMSLHVPLVLLFWFSSLFCRVQLHDFSPSVCLLCRALLFANCSCDRCGAPRQYEFQVQPQLLHYLTMNGGSGPCDNLDWAVVACYTCSASCDLFEEDGPYVEERAWRQPGHELQPGRTPFSSTE